MRPYKAYKFKNSDRIKGPEGLDIWFGHFDCPECAAMYMDIAYEHGYKAGFKSGKKRGPGRRKR